MSAELIVDSSIVAKWVLPEADSEAAVALRERGLAAPDFIDIECGSILWKATRRGEMTAEEALGLHAWLCAAPVTRVPSGPLIASAVAMAVTLRHPIYDCIYLAAAASMSVPLVTADNRLLRLRPPGIQVLGLDDLR